MHPVDGTLLSASKKSSSLQLVPLIDRPDLIDRLATLLNNEWPRSATVRRVSLERCCRSTPPMSLLLIDADSLIGHTKLCPMPNDPKSGWIETLIIQPQLRGKGYGRLLLEFTERLAKTFNYDTVYLSTLDQISFYKRCGYIECPPIVTIGANGSLIDGEKFRVLRERLFCNAEARGTNCNNDNTSTPSGAADRKHIIDNATRPAEAMSLASPPGIPPPPPLPSTIVTSSALSPKMDDKKPCAVFLRKYLA